MRTSLYSLIFIVAIGVLPGCSSQYYKIRTVTPRASYSKAIEKAKQDKWYFILQSGINIYSVTSVDVDKTKQQFTVQLDKVDSLNMAFLKDQEAKRIKPKNAKPSSISKILLYMSDSTSYTLDEPHTLLMDKVAKIELVN